MEIGNALKNERKQLGLTQKEMIAGTNISLSNYSRIERNERKINAEDLYDLLKERKIGLISFIKDHLGVKNDMAEVLTQKIVENFTSHNLVEAVKTKKRIMELEGNESLKYRAILTVAVLENNVKKLSNDLKKKIISTLFSEDNWTDNVSNLKLFADSMLLFKFQDLAIIMHTLFQD